MSEKCVHRNKTKAMKNKRLRYEIYMVLKEYVPSLTQ